MLLSSVFVGFASVFRLACLICAACFIGFSLIVGSSRLLLSLLLLTLLLLTLLLLTLLLLALLFLALLFLALLLLATRLLLTTLFFLPLFFGVGLGLRERRPSDATEDAQAQNDFQEPAEAGSWSRNAVVHDCILSDDALFRAQRYDRIEF